MKPTYDQTKYNYEVNVAPLIASPVPHAEWRVCEILHETDTDFYINTAGGTPLYVRKHWVREVKP